MLASINVITFVACTIKPGLNPTSMLLIILPGALIHGTIVMYVLTVAICFVLAPFTDVDVAIGVDQSSNTISLSVAPLTLKQGTIDPNLSSLSCTSLKVCLPLSEVYNSGVESVRALVHQVMIYIV